MRWKIKPSPDPEKVETLCRCLNVQPIIATLLVQRGIETYAQAEKFFRPKLDDLHDPFLMKDMGKAVDRIETAILNNEYILVFGDYDVDGTTAVSLVSSYLRSWHDKVATYIPDRYAEGYGVSYQGIDFAADNGISLIVALDCGIKSVAHVEYAKKLGIDFIICDHHRPGPVIPDAVAVLDPKRTDCNYPYDELCGCGVGFKLIQAMGGRRGQNIEDLRGYLDLVATAIAADMVPMTGENRVLAYYGLQVINESPRCGIRAMTHNLKKKVLDATDIGFIIAPRINAAGRIRHGNHAVTLLTETDFEQALTYAEEIDKYNKERRDLDKVITREAMQQILDNKEHDRYTTIVFNENWHKGVIGIVASRLIEKYYRPTLVFTQSGDKYAASARSVTGFDVYNALEACAEHLEQFGGHMYAAGMTLKAENYRAFKDAFEQIVQRTIRPDQREREIVVDTQIELHDITPKFLRLIKQFGPFGQDNELPVFMSNGLRDTGYAKSIGADGEHLRLYIRQADSGGVAAVGFGLGDKIERVKGQKQFEAVYCIEENEFNGNISLQLQIKDLR
jgi:single-stranded-DNA-specific exonuclease